MPHDSESFLKAFLSVNKRLLAYVTALVPNAADADEVYQRTCLVLWEKWNEFDSEKDFLPWAFGIARIEVKRYFTEKGRGWDLLGDRAAEIVADTIATRESQLNRRLDLMRSCMERLPRKFRLLLKRCYTGTQKLYEVAQVMDLTPNALYLRLKRVREIVHECVDRALLAEDSP